jgi:cleavage stimulation factor subunit 2
MDGSDILEPTTTELLSHEWDEIYGVLAQINDFLKSKPQEARELLVRNPRFTRALFQAQLQLGIAYLSTGVSADDSPMTSPSALPSPMQQMPLQMAPQMPPQMIPPMQPSMPPPMPPPMPTAIPMGPIGPAPVAPMPSVASVVNDAELAAVLRAITLEEFKKLDATTQNDFMIVRKNLGLPPLPTQ